MKLAHLSLALGFGLLSIGPAFARSDWTAPMNGTVSAVMMSNGGVMMEIKIPQAELQAITRDMKASHDTCIIRDANPGKAGSMILVCGPAGSTVQ